MKTIDNSSSNIIDNVSGSSSSSCTHNSNNSSDRHFKTINSPPSILKSKFKTKLLNGAGGHNSLPSSGSISLNSILSNQNSKALQIFTDNNHLINTNHKLAANHQANRYRQSASPARQRLVAGGGSLLSSSGKLGSTGSQLSVFGRNSKRNMFPPYRTHQAAAIHKVLPIGGSMQNVSPLAYKPPRRSSATGICNENKEKSANNYRSHSVDGLLDNGESTDMKIAEAAALVSAGSLALTNASSTSTLQPNENYNCSTSSIPASPPLVKRREKPSNLPPINPQHRKSRSLDHFLDEQTLAAIVAPPSPTEGTQSMQNLATPMTPEPTRCSTAKAISGLPMRTNISVRDSRSTTPDRVSGLRSSPSNRQSPEGISSTEDEREDSQSIKSVKSSHIPAPATKSQTRAAAHIHRGNSTHNNRLTDGEQNNRVSKTTSNSSLGSTNSSTNPNNKTIFNRTMKKVRSLIKNNEIEDEELPGLIVLKATPPSPGRMVFW